MLKNKYVLDIYVPSHSKGLQSDAKVIQDAIGHDLVRVLSYPFQATEASIETNNAQLKFEPLSDVALFIERTFEHKNFDQYSKRILIPNIEWFTSLERKRAFTTVTDFWHKSHFSLNSLQKIYQEKEHIYIGFTSSKMKYLPPDYESFAHFAGKANTRHSQEIINIWFENTDLPQLTFQSYQSGISLPVWIKAKENLRVFLAFLDQDEYENEFIKHGVHLCTSQMEGFGHYMNEARSIGALILTLDAPPMNELIDRSSGILIPITRSESHGYGTRYFASSDAIKQRIMQVKEMSIQERAALGANAKIRYENERDFFLQKLKSLICARS